MYSARRSSNSIINLLNAIWGQLFNNYYFPSELQEHLQRFVNYYNHERYHESLDNLTPADVYYDRGQRILEQREEIKLDTLAMRRQMHYDRQAGLLT